jgi:hypothetical protein
MRTTQNASEGHKQPMVENTYLKFNKSRTVLIVKATGSDGFEMSRTKTEYNIQIIKS